MLDGDTDWLLDGLARGVIDPHMRDGSGWSLRHTAMWVDHERLLPLLDAAGVPVDARDRAGRTPLYVAVMNGGDVSLIHRLLAAGADPFAETVHGAMVASSAAYRARRDDLDFLTKLLHERWAALRG
ncbi:ankyrin repeat domain-containing protein [Catellatospora bangladeshensis]